MSGGASKWNSFQNIALLFALDPNRWKEYAGARIGRKA